MSEAVETTATEAPATESAPAVDVKPVDAQGGQGANEDRQADDSKLNALQRFAKQAAERKQAKLQARDAVPATEAKSKPEPAATKDAPERDEHGRFVPADGKPKAETKAEPSKHAAEPKEAPAQQAEPKPSAAVEAAKDKLEAAGVEAPEQKAGETNAKYEQRIANLLIEKKRRDAELLETKQKLEPRAKRADELEALHERLRGNDISEEDFEAATGRTFESFVKGLAKAEVKYKPKPQLAPEVIAELAEIRALKAELQADKQRILDERKAAEEAKAKAEREAHEKQAHESDAATCKKWLDEHGEKYPYLASLEDAHLQLRDSLYADWRGKDGQFSGPEPDPEEVAERIEKQLEIRLGTIATSERAIMALLRDPRTRDLVAKQLGTVTPNATDKQPPTRNQGDQKAAAAGPPTLTNKVTQETPVVGAMPDEYSDPEGYKAWWRANFREGNRKRNAVLATIGARNRQAE